MIAVIERPEEIDRFIEIMHEETIRLMERVGGPVDLNQDGMYDLLMDRVKSRFRAWQMEQPWFEGSGAEHEYHRAAVNEAADRRFKEAMKNIGR